MSVYLETQFLSMAIDHFIPVEKQKLIEKNIHWNDESGEWQLKCIVCFAFYLVIYNFTKTRLGIHRQQYAR